MVLDKSLEQHASMCVDNTETLQEAKSLGKELDDDIDEETYERLINAMEPQVAGPGVPAVLAKSNKMWQGRFEELVQFRKQFKHAHTSVYLNNVSIISIFNWL